MVWRRSPRPAAFPSVSAMTPVLSMYRFALRAPASAACSSAAGWSHRSERRCASRGCRACRLHPSILRSSSPRRGWRHCRFQHGSSLLVQRADCQMRTTQRASSVTATRRDSVNRHYLILKTCIDHMKIEFALRCIASYPDRAIPEEDCIIAAWQMTRRDQGRRKRRRALRIDLMV